MAAQPDISTLRDGLRIRRVVTGLWQMADQERDGKAFDLDAAAEALAVYAREGFDTWDMADHYGSAEIVAGRASRLLTQAGETAPVIMTKYCPAPGVMDIGTVRQGVETALERTGLSRIHVMQFHWWQYQSPEWLDALRHLMTLRSEGLIGEIGLTNFDAAHLRMALTTGSRWRQIRSVSRCSTGAALATWRGWPRNLASAFWGSARFAADSCRTAGWASRNRSRSRIGAG